MDKKTLISAVVIVAVIVAGVYFYKNSNQSVIPDVIQNQDQPNLVSDQTIPTVKEFTVNGGNFTFDLKEIVVKKGDTVKIKFVNKEGFHDLKIDEFNVATKQMKAGEEDVVTFLADKTGSFQYYCSIGTHRAMGMWGTLIVE